MRIETASRANLTWKEAAHVCELLGPSLRAEETLPEALRGLPPVAQLEQRLRHFHNMTRLERCAPALCDQLYGQTLETSVSRLEEFAACPFRFALTSGLRVEERKMFRLDVRHRAAFNMRSWPSSIASSAPKTSAGATSPPIKPGRGLLTSRRS